MAYMIDLDVKDRFSLSDSFKLQLHDQKENFGFGLLGAVVYARTYSRIMDDGRQERWPDTVIRVVEGLFTIRKWHYLRNHLHWDEEYWNAKAEEMAQAIFDIKLLGSGRGLWAMGSETVYRIGAAALNNCGSVDVKVLSEDAAWTMDFLMLGVGTGHNTTFFENPTYFIPEENAETEIYVIPDSREGWVESLRRLIASYETEGNPRVEFDYSKIRKAGEPIRGFGGTASGPDPLIKLHERVRGYLDSYALGKTSGTRMIVDTMNAIGACVVAGNVRRSAEISLGDPNDEEFINLKNYELNPERAEIGWMCLTNDMWITTTNGPRQIKDLVEQPFTAVVDGKAYPSQGFFKAGEKKLVEINAQGYVLKSSPDHKIMTDKGWVKAGDLQEGDKIRLQDHPSTLTWGGKGTEDEGFILGAVVGDGWIIENGRIQICSGTYDEGAEPFRKEIQRIANQYDMFHKSKTHKWVRIEGKDEMRMSLSSIKDMAKSFGIQYGNKSITPEVEGASREFYIGFLRGLFDTDGSIEILGNNKKSRGVRLAASDENVIQGAQRMLSRLGIRSKVHSIKKNTGWGTKPAFALTIRGIDAARYAEIIGFTNTRKTELLSQQGATRNSSVRNFATVEKINHTDDTVTMYDCMVEDVHAYDANGIYVSNSNNSVIMKKHSDFTTLPSIAQRVRDNGEPGIINLMNIQKYGRYGEKTPDKATSTNPCAEIPLESYELCNLAEVFPTRCVDENGEFSEEEFIRVVELAALYTATVSLLPTHDARTNAVVARNRRTGVSLSGIADWLADHPATNVITWLDKGYKAVREENNRLNEEAGVPPAVRVTTVKPSGTVSLLAGVSSGMHLPPFSRYIRRVRVGENTPIVPILKEANVPHEKDVYSDNTLVFEFPVDQGKVKGQKDVSVWAKAQTVVMLQKFWSDNMVSNTLSFDPIREGDQIEDLLTYTVPYIKSISLLPLLDEGSVYEQSPIEQITLEEVNRRKKEIKEIDWDKFSGSDGEDSKFCTTDNCEWTPSEN